MVEAYECDELADDSSRWKTNEEIQEGSWEECYKEEEDKEESGPIFQQAEKARTEKAA